MNAPSRISFPKRWSRAKRKRVRAVVMAAQWRAFYWRQLTDGMKTYLDAAWGDAMKAQIDWESVGFSPSVGGGEFVDDRTFLVNP